MADSIYFRKLALSFEGTIELPHFDRTSFRANGKIWATMQAAKQQANLLLSPIDQSVFCAFDATIIYPVNNKWGLNGATTVELTKIKKGMLKDIMTTAYQQAFIKKNKK